MHDLVGAYKRMRQVYQWYIESAFPLRYEALSNERRNLLSQQGILSQPPLLETIPVYPSSGYNLAEASQLLPSEYQDLQYLAQALFPTSLPLWPHQLQCLQEVLINKRDIIVTTGTGIRKDRMFSLTTTGRIGTRFCLLADMPTSTRSMEVVGEGWSSLEQSMVTYREKNQKDFTRFAQLCSIHSTRW